MPELDLDYPAPSTDFGALAESARQRAYTVRRRRRATSVAAVAVVVAAVGLGVGVTRGAARQPVTIGASPPPATTAATAPGVFTGTSPRPATFIGLTGSGGETPTVYDSTTFARERTLGRSSQYLDVLSGDGKTLFQPIDGCGYTAVDIATGAQSTPPWPAAHTAVPSPSGTSLAYDTCTDPDTLHLQSLTSDRSYTFPAAATPFSWSPDGRAVAVLATAGEGLTRDVELVDAATVQPVSAEAVPAAGCTFSSPSLLSDTDYLVLEDCADGKVSLLREHATPDRVTTLARLVVHAAGGGDQNATMSVDVSGDNAAVELNGGVVIVDAAGVHPTPLTDTYQVLWH